MAIDPREIAAGKCYVTAGEQVRRVVGIRGADVSYEMRTRSMAPGSWGPKRMVSVANFAATVEREVPCEEVAASPEPSAAAPEPAATLSLAAAVSSEPRAEAEPPAVLSPEPGPVSDPIVEARDLLAAAVDEAERTERLARLYAAADILVRAIEDLEREA